MRSNQYKTGMRHHTVHAVWAGNERGECIQIRRATPIYPPPDNVEDAMGYEGFVQLDMREAAELVRTLLVCFPLVRDLYFSEGRTQ